MTGKIHIYFLTALLIVIGSVAYAQDQSPTRYETALLKMINSARQNPLSIAASLGMDTQKIISDLPELAGIFKNGLAPLAFDSKLYQSASLHAQDMMDKNYYSAVSPDKKSVQERILETGYIPIVSGESMGMLSFGNFMEPDKAVKAIFHNMFADELDPARTEKRNILNPDLKDMGISLKAGIFTFEGTSENVYVSVCDFGNSDISLLESSLRDMIDEPRNIVGQTEQTVVYGADKNVVYGTDKDAGLITPSAVSAGSPAPAYELSPSLTWNENLCDAAKTHIQDMRKNLYFDNISPDGKTPFDRVSAAGYNAVYVNETLGAIGFEHFLDPTEALRIFYEQMIKNNIATTEEKNTFDIKAKDVGMSFDIFLMDNGNGNVLKVFIIVVEFGNDLNIFSPATREENYHKFYYFNNL